METLYYNSYESLANKVTEDYYAIGDISASIITSDYTETKEILSELAFLGFSLYYVELDPTIDNEEYLIILDQDGISCELAKANGKPKIHETDLLYLSNDASSTFLSAISYGDVVAFEVDEEADDIHDKLLEDNFTDRVIADLDVQYKRAKKNYDEITSAIMRAFSSL